MKNEKNKLILESYVKKVTEQVLREQLESGVIDEATFGRLMKGLSNVGNVVKDKANQVVGDLANKAVEKTNAVIDKSKAVVNKVADKAQSTFNDISKSIDNAKTKISNAYTAGEMEDIKLDIEKFVKKAAELVAEYNVKAEKIGTNKISLTGVSNKVAPPSRKKVQ